VTTSVLPSHARPHQPSASETSSHEAAHFIFGLALAALSALLATWAFPPYGVWWLIFVAWVPMLIAQHAVLPKRWSWLAVGVGIGGYAAGYLHGVIDTSFAWWVLWIPLGAGLLAGVGSILVRSINEATGYVSFVFGIPLIWTAGEFLRGFVPGIGTQGYMAYALFREPWALQPVSLVGINALNLLILVVNWTIGLVVLVGLERRRSPDRRLITTGVLVISVLGTAVTVSAWIGVSLLMFRADPPSVKVAAIQPGIHSPQAAELSRDIAQTHRAAHKGARLVVWQEKTLAGDPRHDAVGAQLAALAQQTHVYLVVGFGVVTGRGQINDATVVSPSGRYLGVYGKQHPATMFADDQSSLDAGPMPIYKTPFGRLATIICFDLDYTDTAREAALQGAQILAVPSWDPPGDSTKHYGMLVFRAIENRLTIIKAESAYDSAIIDPYGRILDSVVTPQGSRATLVADVPVGTGHTLLVTLGDLWGWIVVAAAVCMIALGRRRPFADRNRP
jgi:apolipoprotein N-acyltransferase